MTHIPTSLSSLFAISNLFCCCHTSVTYSFFFLMLPPPPRSTLFPYTTLFRSTEAICFTSGVVRKFLRNTHDLLLIHDQAVGLAEDFFQCFFQLWVNRRNFLAPILTVRVVPVRVHTHRSWTIQRQRSHDIFKAGWLHALQQLLHTAGVQLEHA